MTLMTKLNDSDISQNTTSDQYHGLQSQKAIRTLMERLRVERYYCQFALNSRIARSQN